MHGIRPRTDEVEPDAADMNFPRRFYFCLGLNLFDACNARLAVAPRALVESVVVNLFGLVASAASPDFDRFRMGGRLHLRLVLVFAQSA